jgi:hypothetical protein
MPKMTKEQALAFVQGSQEAEFIIRTPSEETTFLTNYRNVEIERDMKPKVKEIYDRIDRDVLTSTGIPKNADEKTYDYAVRVLKDFKDQLSNADVKKLKEQIEELKKNGGGVELENVRSAAAKKEKDLTDKIALLNQQLVQREINAHLSQAMTGLKFKEIPKPVLDTYIEATKAKMTARAKMVDGKVVFMKEDGTAELDLATYLPASAETLLREELKDIIDNGIVAKGSGTTPPANVTKDKDGKTVVSVHVPASIKTQGELTDHLLKAGLVRGSNEFMAAFKQYGSALPLQ